MQAVWYSQGVENCFPGYTLENFRFVVFSKDSKYKYPIIWEVSSEEYTKGYMKIQEMLEHYQWRVDLGNWATPVDVYKNQGLLTITE